MTELSLFIQAADRLVGLDARFKPDEQSTGSLAIFKNKVQELWDDIEVTYRTLLDFIASDDSTMTSAERSNIEEKYSTMFTTYALLQGRIDSLLQAMQNQPTSRLATPHSTTQRRLSAFPGLPPPAETLQVPSGSRLQQQEQKSTTPGAHPAYPTLYSAEPSPLLSRLCEPLETHYPSDPFSHRLPLPPCDIKPFKGDYSSWPSFRDLFKAVFVNNKRLSDVERLFHLLHHTEGDAKDIVSRAPLTHEGFQLAWDQLSSRYENKRVLINSQLKTLFSLPAIMKETGESIKKLQRDINACLHILKTHEISIANWDPILIFHCCQRLPEATVILWEQSLINKTQVSSWKELDDFLSFRILTLESIQETRSSSLLSNTQTAPQANVRTAKIMVTRTEDSRPHAPQGRSSNPQKGCPICPHGHHTIYKCSKFRALTTSERWTKVNRLRLCSNCLGSAHLNKDCTSKYVCSICGARHHSWLHKAPSNQPNDAPHPATATVEPEQCPPSTQFGAPRAFHQHSLRNVQKASSHKTVLLGTANILLHYKGCAHSVRALLDSGSEVSCISNTLRKRLGLTSKPANTTLLGVNSQVTATASQICELSIGPSNDKTVKYECSAFVLPRISGNLPTVSIDWIAEQSLPDFPLADKQFFRSSPVDILIGADLYPSIMSGGLQHKVFGSLLAQETAFGWVLTGPLPDVSRTSQAASARLLAQKAANLVVKDSSLTDFNKRTDDQITGSPLFRPPKATLNKLRASPVQLHASQAAIGPCGAMNNHPANSASHIARVVARDVCQLCRRGHPLMHCHQFQRLSVAKRLWTVVKYGVCCRCLSRHHTAVACPSVGRCRTCQQRDHNTMLHLEHHKHHSQRSSAVPRAKPPRESSHSPFSRIAASSRHSLQPTNSARVRSTVL